MWKELLEGTLIPREYSKEEYMAIKAYYKANKDSLLVPNLGEIGFVGFICSYCGKWFAGHVSDGIDKRRPEGKQDYNFQVCGINGINKQVQHIQHSLGEIGFVGFNCSYCSKWWGGFRGSGPIGDRTHNYQVGSMSTMNKQIQQMQHSLGEIGYAGFNCSYGGDWMRGYIRNDYKGNNGKPMTSRTHRYNNIVNQLEVLKEESTLILSCGGYEEMSIPPNSIIYCDPPYQNTTSYGAVDAFDHNAFWQWCREKTLEGHKVYISEYNAPDDFECVWSKELYNAIGKGDGEKPIEKLFIYKG